MDFWYNVAERLIAHFICITPFLLLYCVAYLISRLEKEIAFREYIDGMKKTFENDDTGKENAQ